MRTDDRQSVTMKIELKAAMLKAWEEKSGFENFSQF